MNEDYEKENILIINASPYSPSSNGRFLKSYFSKININHVAQIYSVNISPSKGVCNSFYQITDIAMLKAFIHNKEVKENIYSANIDSFEEEGLKSKESKIIQFFYKLGKKPYAINHMLRKKLWAEKRWNTEKLNNWINSFKPSVIFCGISDDFYFHNIASYISKKFNIPIIPCVVDDYYFNNKKSIFPIYLIYRNKIMKSIDEIFKKAHSAVFISDKIKKLYETHFSIKGETIYLASDLKPNMKISTFCKDKQPLIRYFGNIGLGRYKTLIAIANSHFINNNKFKIDIFTSEKDKKIINKIKQNKNINLYNAIKYEEVKIKMQESNLLIIAEDFSKKNLKYTEYSLSTKVADCISSGVTIFAAGNSRSGCISFLKKNNLCFVAINKEEIEQKIRDCFCNEKMRNFYFNKSLIQKKEKFNYDVSGKTFIEVLKRKNK